MRSFSDGTGRKWDVVAGRESWGAVFAIFIPSAHEGDGDDAGAIPGIRQTPLQGTGYVEATARLEELSEADLRAMLDRSEPKTTG